jgi:hypothetical protein
MTLGPAWSALADETAAALVVAHMRGDRVEIVTSALAPTGAIPATATSHILRPRRVLDMSGMSGAGLRTWARARGRWAVVATSAAIGEGEPLAAAEVLVGAPLTPPDVPDVAAFTTTRRLLMLPAPGLLRGATNPDADRPRAGLAVVAVTGGDVGAPIFRPSGAILVVEADGSVAYDPRPGHAGLALGATAVETVGFTVASPSGQSVATLRITVAGAGPRQRTEPWPSFSRDFADGFSRTI